MPRTISQGATGVEVLHLQGLLNGRPPTALPPLQTDGIFGPKTNARVKEFQKNAKLAVDGIVGALTWAKLEAGLPAAPPADNRPACGTCRGENQTLWPPNLLRKLAQQVLAGLSAVGAKGPTAASPSASLPTTARAVNSGELAVLTPVFGTSIDWKNVVVTDALGASGRAFVVSSPAVLGVTSLSVQVVNWGPSPSTHTMIHEMTHVWQAQHHANPTQYMATALANQGAADVAQAAASKLGLTTAFSAYAYVPGRPFGTYGAEQIAQQVANAEAAVRAVVKAGVPWLPDPMNTLSLANLLTGFEDRLKPGVKI